VSDPTPRITAVDETPQWRLNRPARIALFALVVFLATWGFYLLSRVIGLAPLTRTFLLIGIPALVGLFYVFIKGTPELRRYVVTRISLTIPMVLILATLVFLVLRIIPGDPVTSSLGPKGSPEVKEQLREDLGLNDPLYEQYGRFIGGLFTFDLGNSLIGGQRPIVDELGERLPATLELVVPGAALALLIGIFFGTWAAVKRKRPTDYGIRVYSVVIYSMPIFWLGLMLQVVFGVWLNWFPLAGRADATLLETIDRQTNLYLVDTFFSWNWEALLSVLNHLVLPVATLGLVLSGVFVRLTRINVIETLQEDFVVSARARGVKERAVTYKYALKNAMIPVITLIGLQVAILLAGAVLTETVFSWPGMGRYLVDRIFARDFTAVQNTIAIFAIFVAVISLTVDIVYSLIDPRVKY
jgi:peptide/nickel transport system permease protein